MIEASLLMAGTLRVGLHFERGTEEQRALVLQFDTDEEIQQAIKDGQVTFRWVFDRNKPAPKAAILREHGIEAEGK